MKLRTLLFATVSVVALLSLGACQSLLTNLQGCERLYDGAANGGIGALFGASFTGTAKVYCSPASGDAKFKAAAQEVGLKAGKVVGETTK